MTGFEELFGPHRILAILRGLLPAETVAVAGQAWEAGVELLEVTIGSPEQVASLSAAVAAGAERGKLVGAGTVISLEQVRAAARAGARYTVAPGFDPAVLAASLAAGLPHLPGVASPSEVQRARGAGVTWVKAFPATSLGPEWFRAIRGPFPDLHYVATGGIALADARGFLDAGARVVGLGPALLEPAQRAQLTGLVTTASG